MLENIQTDIWVRAMRMAGHEVHFVCADDAHGTSIMLRAEKEGITPEALISGVLEQHKRDLIEAGGRREVLMLVPVVFLELPVVILFALYPGLVSLSQLAR